MSEISGSRRVVIIGGHGKVARLAAPRLVGSGYAVDSLIRNPDQQSAVAVTGAIPVVLDVETATVGQLAEVFGGASAIVFSAGAGGGNPARTRAVDFEAATRSMDAAAVAGVNRFVMVSYATSTVDPYRLDPDDSFYPYASAKNEADTYLRASELDFSILGPGSLTLEPGTGRIQLADDDGNIYGRIPTADDKKTSRENVADVIVHVIAENAAVRETVNFYDGPTPIAEALPGTLERRPSDE